MKKILIMITMLTMTMVAKAQFEAGKMYVNASLSGLDLSYNGTEEGKFNFGAMAGYCFFLNDKLTIEPSVYYDQSFRKHSDYSTVGLRISLGVYF